jgi:ribonuclease BN (tRNA processing enzyme)
MSPIGLRRIRRILLAGAAVSLIAAQASAQSVTRYTDPTPFCGDEGVWVQILGGGGPDLDDGETHASYVVFLDNRARLLVDPAPGSSSLFDQAGARVEDLDAILLTRLEAERTAELPAYLLGGRLSGRDRPLAILGPDGSETRPDTETFLTRLIGSDGAYPELAGFLEPRGIGGFRAAPQNVPATGNRRWGGFGNERMRVSAIPVTYGDVPALAWRVEIGGKRIVFTGDFNNRKNLMHEFARGADTLVIHHSVHEGVRGELTDYHVTPGQIGRIAAQAGARMVFLGHRTNRTRGRESQSRAAIEEHYDGPIIFANDLECWGL